MCELQWPPVSYSCLHLETTYFDLKFSYEVINDYDGIDHSLIFFSFKDQSTMNNVAF